MKRIAFLFVLAATFAQADLLPKAEQTGTFVVPGQEGMHRELIPKSITIVHCSYELDVVAPGTTFGFDIIGSGFNEAFYDIISIDPDALDVSVKNLRLVTANQIHGQIEVGTEATTQYIRPMVVIRALPVFRAPDPFGVVRAGEVLDIELTQIDDTGQWGRFRVTTNLNATSYPKFKLTPTHPMLEISNIKPQFPFYIDGVLMIGQGLKHGHYGIVANMGKREIFRQDPIVDVVRPTVGKTGSIEKVEAKEKAHRPGDSLSLNIKGSAFLPDSISSLSLKVSPMEMGQAGINYVSAGLLEATISIPGNAPVGIYSVTTLVDGKVLQEDKNVFAIVPPNWLASATLTTPLAPGKSSQVLLQGRDISQEFAATVRVETDTDGLKVTNLHWQDMNTIIADVSAAEDLAPGDYLMNVSAKGKALRLPRGNIIKVAP